MDIFSSNGNAIDDKELLMFLEGTTSGNICMMHKYSGMGQDKKENKWGTVKFLSPDAAKQATFLNEVKFNGGFLKMVPSRSIHGSDQKMFHLVLIARVSWPCRYSKGVGFLKCDPGDVAFMVDDFSNLMIGKKNYLLGGKQ